MKIEYKTISISEIYNLNEYGKDGWITSIIVKDVIIMYREVKKPKTTTDIVVKTNSNTLTFLTLCKERREQSREWGDKNGIPEEVLFEFAAHWLEKGENDKKYRFEKEKVFDVNKRLRTWINKPWNKQKEKVSSVTF